MVQMDRPGQYAASGNQHMDKKALAIAQLASHNDQADRPVKRAIFSGLK